MADSYILAQNGNITKVFPIGNFLATTTGVTPTVTFSWTGTAATFANTSITLMQPNSNSSDASFNSQTGEFPLSCTLERRFILRAGNFTYTFTLQNPDADKYEGGNVSFLVKRQI